MQRYWYTTEIRIRMNLMKFDPTQIISLLKPSKAEYVHYVTKY